MTKYQCPADVEAAMDRFAEDNPGAGWRAVIRGFQRAIKQSMRAGGDLYKNPHAMKREICGDCGVKEGQLHIPGCDMELLCVLRRAIDLVRMPLQHQHERARPVHPVSEFVRQVRNALA